MPYEKYITKQDVIDFYDIDDASDVKDVHMRAGQYEVNSWLRIKGYDPDNYDGTYEDLYCAALFFIGELLSKIGVVTWSVGEIEEERFGVLSRRFPRWQPMFFFARGMAADFYGLLPHETYRMAAYQFINRFNRTYDKDTLRDVALVIEDTSYRGYGWNHEPGNDGSELTEFPDELNED